MSSGFTEESIHRRRGSRVSGLQRGDWVFVVGSVGDWRRCRGDFGSESGDQHESL